MPPAETGFGFEVYAGGQHQAAIMLQNENKRISMFYDLPTRLPKI